MFWYTRLIKITGASSPALAIMLDDIPGVKRSVNGSWVIWASPGNRIPAKETNSPVTSKDVTRDKEEKVWVPIRAVQQATHAKETVSLLNAP
mmetsp:Transcript_5475/g.12899  ORF Transcript_5475/g.12899 Transcript_5475/m.12899 type:complete len:92 (+) Transcript_5475:673-948(+)